jgi:serine/threonine protein kinase
MSKVKLSEDGTMAIKTVSLFDVDAEGADSWSVHLQGEAINEVVALRRLSDCHCPHIVSVYDVRIDTENGTMIFREKAMDPLPVYISDNELVRRYIRDIFEGLYGMQRAGVVHRDIKLNNLMIDRDLGDLRYIDFGLSTIDSPPRSRGYQEIYTLPFRPPELLLESADYDVEKAEVWAAGVCAASMLLGCPLLFMAEDRIGVLSKIVGAFGYFSSSWDSLPLGARFVDSEYTPNWTNSPLLDMIEDPLAKDFVARSMMLNPSKRGTVLELLHHPYINGIEMGGAPAIHYVPPHPIEEHVRKVLNQNHSTSIVWAYTAEKILDDYGDDKPHLATVAAVALSGIIRDRFVCLGESEQLTECKHGQLPACKLVMTLLNPPATLENLTRQYRLATYGHNTPINITKPPEYPTVGYTPP